MVVELLLHDNHHGNHHHNHHLRDGYECIWTEESSASYSPISFHGDLHFDPIGDAVVGSDSSNVKR